jgi:hypothetical protein
MWLNDSLFHGVSVFWAGEAAFDSSVAQGGFLLFAIHHLLIGHKYKLL